MIDYVNNVGIIETVINAIKYPVGHGCVDIKLCSHGGQSIFKDDFASSSQKHGNNQQNTSQKPEEEHGHHTEPS